jgi:hypothetical protein
VGQGQVQEHVAGLGTRATDEGQGRGRSRPVHQNIRNRKDYRNDINRHYKRIKTAGSYG